MKAFYLTLLSALVLVVGSFQLNAQNQLDVESAGNLDAYFKAPGSKYLWFQESGSNKMVFGHSGTDIYLWNYETGGDVQIGANGTTDLFIETGGEVGIGTTSPSAKLDVVGNVEINTGSLDIIGPGEHINFRSSSTGNHHIRYYGADNAFDGAIFFESADDHINISNSFNSAGLLVDLSNNRVGVGTDVPGGKLDVVSDETVPAIDAEVTYSGNSNVIAIRGESTPSTTGSNAGYGGYFTGGYMGARGIATGQTGTRYGVYGQATSSTSGNAYGVYGFASSSGTGTKYGVYGSSSGAGNYGVYSNGRMRATWSHSAITGDNMPMEANVSGSASSYSNGIRMTYSGSSNQGAKVIARNTSAGGINVGQSIGGGWAPIHASAFNVSSDRRLKRDINTVADKSAEKYMEALRKVETATYYYNDETPELRKKPHLGVIAQTMPEETTVMGKEFADGTGEDRLKVSLGDWLGFVTVAAKENDRRILELEAENTSLQNANKALEARLAKLESIILENQK